MIEGHISRAFDGALSSLHLRVVQMGGLVLSQVQGAVSAYADWSRAGAEDVLARDNLLVDYARGIEEEALLIIARRQPVASDLRLVMAIQRAVGDLERIGAESRKIAKLVVVDSTFAGSSLGAETTREVRQIGRLAASMLRAALTAFDGVDATAAERVIPRDRDLDDEYANALRRLLTRTMEDPRRLQQAVECAFVLKSIERVGDHARNIAAQVVYLVRGVTADAGSRGTLVGHSE